MSSSNSGGSDFHQSIYKLLNMTLACRPSNPIDFAATFFVDEQHVQHELAHAIHQVRFFEDNKSKFREQLSVIFFIEVGDEKSEDSIREVDCISLKSVIRVIKVLYGENIAILTAILDHFAPGQHMTYIEFEDIVEMTVICLNFATYLKTNLCHAMNNLEPCDSPVTNTITIQFLEGAFKCLQEVDPVLPNLAQEDISLTKWHHRVRSVLHALKFFQDTEAIKLDAFLGECVSHYFELVKSKSAGKES